VQATVGGRNIVVGKPSFVAQRSLAPQGFARDLEAAAQPVIHVAVDGNLIGAIELRTPCVRRAAEAVTALRSRQMTPYLVTGDNERVAHAVGEQLGITEMRAGILPDGKADIVRELQADGGRVAMVGDGINDAPAFMQANVGIAIGAGTDIAIESADIIVVGERITALADAYDIAAESYTKTKQNRLLAVRSGLRRL